MNKYVDKDGLQYFAEELTAKNKEIFAVKAEVGTPLVAATAAAMTDTSKIYVYTGSETGYTAGDWYYYDGSDWQSGGVYNSAAVQTDTSLSVAGMAADAKTVGDDLDALDGRLDTIEDDYVTESEMTAAISANVDNTLSVSGKAADAKATGDALKISNHLINHNNSIIYDGSDTISSYTGFAGIITNGHCELTPNPSLYWKTLVAPVACLYIDGVATLKTGGLSGNQSVGIPTMAFLDENYDVVGTPVYTSIAAPHTFNATDIPSGAVYVICEFSNTFTFAFQSINKSIEINKSGITELNVDFENAGKYPIELAFSSATGYYNKDKGFTTYAGVTYASVDVSEGQVFYLTSRNYYGMARAAFMDENDDCIGVLYTGNNAEDMSDTRFVVPTNAVKMLIQTVYGHACYLWITNLASKIDNMVTAVETTIEDDSSDVQLSFSSATGYYNKDSMFTTYAGVTVATISVTAGQKYLLTTRNYYDAAIAALFDSEDNIISVVYNANNTAEVKKQEIVIPDGAVTLMVQCLYGYEPTKLALITGVKIKPVKSVLSGKKMTIIGDSITEKNLRAKTNWALWIKDWCDPTIQNLGASGTGFIAGGSNPYHNRIASIQASPDIIGVAVSFNDMGNTVADLTTAAETFFDDLIDAFPTVPIICYVQSPWSSYHYGITESDDWIDALRDICHERGVPFYDEMYKGSALKPWLEDNRAVYYMNDGEGSTGEEDWVHPNSEGHKVIARHLYPLFARNLVTVGLDYFD